MAKTGETYAAHGENRAKPNAEHSAEARTQ